MSVNEQIARLKADTKKKWSFSLECGRGQTYSHSRPVLYGYSTYGRGSVLAGRPERLWMETWDDWEEARKELNAIPKFKYDDMGDEESGCGSTHIPIDVLTAGLPDSDC